MVRGELRRRGRAGAIDHGRTSHSPLTHPQTVPCSPPPCSPAPCSTSARAQHHNPYFPLPPGRGGLSRGKQRVEVTVTDRTKLIANGVEARVVRDEVTLKGVPVESPTTIRPGPRGQRLVPRRGDHRVRARQAGLDRRAPSRQESTARRLGSMPARPKVGMRYRQESQGSRRGPREDRLGARAREGPAPPLPQDADDARDQPARAGRPRGEVLRPRRGLVLAVGLSGGTDREELIRARARTTRG